MLHNGHQALVVDPVDAHPVMDALKRLGVTLELILVTHHNADHTRCGVALRLHTGCKVFGPALEPMPESLTRLPECEQVHALGLTFNVLDVPGHTSGHIAYYCQQVNGAPLLLCGDTLFIAGCDRQLEETAAQMLQSLRSMSDLPEDTPVCCTDEYTLSNLDFAAAADPEDSYLIDHTTSCRWLRAEFLSTLPSNIRTEKLINPFLRARKSTLISATQTFAATAKDDICVFAALRQWKNPF
ncbi:hydroxyacylglutathione hydrolase [Rhodoferax sp. PAMC 29310]|uniref:hydroxyacylglutathione hydrolase n=1 Tax=Rhodoferax sp. PAMC 29310 TaxID=2822760 RepID=UPI00351D0006